MPHVLAHEKPDLPTHILFAKEKMGREGLNPNHLFSPNRGGREGGREGGIQLPHPHFLRQNKEGRSPAGHQSNLTLTLTRMLMYLLVRSARLTTAASAATTATTTTADPFTKPLSLHEGEGGVGGERPSNPPSLHPHHLLRKEGGVEEDTSGSSEQFHANADSDILADKEREARHRSSDYAPAPQLHPRRKLAEQEHLQARRHSLGVFMCICT